MQLDKYEIENLLEKYGELIDEGDFEKLFMRVFKDYSEPSMVGAISGFFYDSGLNYLEDMKYVPTCAFYKAELDVLEVPEGIIKIEDFAFANSKMSKIILPKSLQEVAENAFYGCNDLTEVEYHGTKDRWYDLDVRLPRTTKVNFK